MTIRKASAAAFAFSALLGTAAFAQPYAPYAGGGDPYVAPGDPYASGPADAYVAPGDPYASGPADAYAAAEQPYDAAEQPYDYDGGYCDEYGCPDDYYDLPIYYGPVYFDDFWYQGPLYYRTWQGRPQYWIHGGWHYDQWQGPRPSQYAVGRYGPALSRDWYRRNFPNAGAFHAPAHEVNGGRSFAARPQPQQQARNGAAFAASPRRQSVPQHTAPPSGGNGSPHNGGGHGGFDHHR